MAERDRHDEAARLAALERYRILDTAPEQAFDDIATLAAALSGARMAAVSFVAGERQWFKARVDVPMRETPRDVAFCNRVVSEGVPVVVPDARSDVRFATNPLVTGPPHLAFYAGVPVCAREGEVLGTLCVLDDQPLVLSDSQLAALEALARQVEAQLDLRRSLAEAVGPEAADDELAASFAAAFEHTPVGMTLVDVEGNYLRVNRAFCNIVGRRPDEILGRIAIDLVAPTRRTEEVEVGFRMLAGELDSNVRDSLLLLADGTTVRVRLSTSLVRSAEGEPLVFLSQVEDISRRGEAEDAFAVTQTALEAIISIDGGGRITFWNPSAEAMFGYRAGEVVGAPITVIIPAELRDDYLARFRAVAAGLRRRPLGLPVEFTAQRRSGARFPIEISVAEGGAGDDRFYTAVIRDITERKEFETRLERRANVDELTGLATQGRFLEQVAATLDESGRAVVLRVDVDDFKVVNDSLGHEAGDFVLTQLARRLQAELGPDDVAARLGGDEFGVLCACHDRDEALALGHRIADAMKRPLVVGRRELSLSVGTGVAEARLGQRPLDVLRQADTAMHRAKTLGRGRTEVFDDRLQQRAVERLDTEAGLRQALEHGHLVLHYQPEIDLRSGRIVGAEALVRWEHPQRGLLMPGQFIAVAEETRLIDDVSEWVVGAALRQLSRWRHELAEARSFTVAVNLSGNQLGDERIVGVVAEALAASACPPEALMLEVTETAVMSEPEASARVLAGLAELGVRLAIDDFGTGYSSLAYLQRFPLHLLKVDRSFVQGLDTEDGRAIVRAVVALASGLGMATVAEGVETQEQLAAIRELGCDIGQGFLMARPLPAKATADLLTTAPRW